jgi:predicted MFS family arabinose efflux permease
MKWIVVAVLWGVAVLNYLDRQVVFSLLPLLQHDLHATGFQLGLISTVFLWTYGLLSPLGGFIADRIGRTRVILASLAIWTLATWLTSHVSSIEGMLWTRGLMGASEAFYLPAALALIADLHGNETRSLATGLHQSGLYTGLVLGGAWGGWMGERAGWREVFSILGIVGVLYLAIAALTLRREPPRPRTPQSAANFLELLRAPGFFAVLGAFTAMAIANWLIYTWLPLFLFERYHLSLSGAGFSATFYLQAASYVGVVIGGVLTDRWATRNPRARAWVQMIGMAIAAPFLVALAAAGSMFVLIPALVAFGFGRGLFDCNTMPLLRNVTGPERSATGYGILNLSSCLAGGVGAAAAGWMKESIGLASAFELAALVLVAGAFSLRRLVGVKDSLLAADEHR